MAKKFFYTCGGILMLALAYHFGATNAGAQAPSNPIVAADNIGNVYSANGDVYRCTSGDCSIWTHIGNIFTAPTPVQPTSFGALKVRYR